MVQHTRANSYKNNSYARGNSHTVQKYQIYSHIGLLLLTRQSLGFALPILQQQHQKKEFINAQKRQRLPGNMLKSMKYRRQNRFTRYQLLSMITTAIYADAWPQMTLQLVDGPLHLNFGLSFIQETITMMFQNQLQYYQLCSVVRTKYVNSLKNSTI